ncbi:PEP-CTERM sorting domain-containing protein [Bowmanella sp. Y26]|uniref:PEP-CTERM sorting domain-containing protein n=1 Tax=Bowmanella yangjiangensis TaxID=2811230 RepID=UPI001BDD46D6|nr:PEP-CTERM sorting domain-containing protein [Bowmanella yangjiangensis]MBT1065741.1 PEP-CTERM sorting domain-containing protein [Bowmanella yangjiangensis]
MKNKFLQGLVASFALTVSGIANAGLIIPEGIQTSINESTVKNTWGWTECFSGNSRSWHMASSALSSCDGDLLMMATRLTGSDTFSILAAASFDIVTMNTSLLQNAASTNIENGVSWYSNASSWGFADIGTLINQTSADVNWTIGKKGLSWHTNPNNNGSGVMTHFGLGYGYSIGNGFIPSHIEGEYESVLLTASSTNVSTSIPEPSTLAIFLISLMGFAYRNLIKKA